MRRVVLLAVGAALALGGCSLDDGEESSGSGQGGQDSARSGSSEADAIRAWSKALNRGDYDEAASFFARGAIVEQVEEVRLPDMDAAEAFNRSLPCRADVTDVEDEGDTQLAAFRLRGGPGGPCQGAARVRFRFRDGKFSEWRQLPGGDMPRGEIATRHREGRDASLG